MVTVNNTTELTTELNNATGGETIELAAGVNFGDYTTPSGKTYSSAVTITSLDTNNKGVFRSLEVTSDKFILDDVLVDYTYSPGDDVPAFFIINVSGRDDITIRNCEVIGDVDSDGESNATGRAIYMNSGTNLVIEDNYFHDLHDCLDARNVDGITFTGNEQKNCGSDGIQLSTCQNATITGNLFHNWTKVRTDGHVDAIQLLRPFGGCSNILIEENVFDMANGHYGQMIWSGADGRDMGDPFYRHTNITIRNNIIYAGSIICIAINGVDTYTIEKNLVQEAQSTTANFAVPNITIYSDSTNVTFIDNIYPTNNFQEPLNPAFTMSNNHLLTKSDWGPTDQLIAQATGDVNGYTDIQINSGAAHTGLAGSRMAKRTGGWSGQEITPHPSYQGGVTGSTPSISSVGKGMLMPGNKPLIINNKIIYV